jgi:hypothetical protein
MHKLYLLFIIPLRRFCLFRKFFFILYYDQPIRNFYFWFEETVFYFVLRPTNPQFLRLVWRNGFFILCYDQPIHNFYVWFEETVFIFCTMTNQSTIFTFVLKKRFLYFVLWPTNPQCLRLVWRNGFFILYYDQPVHNVYVWFEETFFLFCTMTNQCTIISQIITLLLHVSTLLCLPQVALS